MCHSGNNGIKKITKDPGKHYRPLGSWTDSFNSKSVEPSDMTKVFVETLILTLNVHKSTETLQTTCLVQVFFPRS